MAEPCLCPDARELPARRAGATTRCRRRERRDGSNDRREDARLHHRRLAAVLARCARGGSAVDAVVDADEYGLDLLRAEVRAEEVERGDAAERAVRFLKPPSRIVAVLQHILGRSGRTRDTREPV